MAARRGSFFLGGSPFQNALDCFCGFDDRARSAATTKPFWDQGKRKVGGRGPPVHWRGAGPATVQRPHRQAFFTPEKAHFL